MVFLITSRVNHLPDLVYIINLLSNSLSFWSRDYLFIFLFKLGMHVQHEC